MYTLHYAFQLYITYILDTHVSHILTHAVAILLFTYTHTHTLQTHCTHTLPQSPVAHFHVHSCSLSKHTGSVCCALLFLCATVSRLLLHSSVGLDTHAHTCTLSRTPNSTGAATSVDLHTHVRLKACS